MPNLFSLIQQPYFILLLLIGLGVVLFIAFLFVNYLKKDPYSIGRRKGKKLARIMLPHRTSKDLEKDSDHEQFKKQIQKVSEEIFETGFIHERNEAHRTIEMYEREIEKLLAELQKETASLNQQVEGKKASYEKQQAELRERIKQVENELQQRRNKEEMAIQDLDARKKAPGYRLVVATSRLGAVLSSSLKTLETDLLWFGMTGVFLLLLAGDFFITFDLFSDLRPTWQVTNPEFLYIGSSIFALVFVVLFEFFFEYLEKKSEVYRERVGIIQIWAIGIIGFLLFLVYLLFISVSLFPTIGGRLLDGMLRFLFLPLVIATALFLQKIRIQYGFKFLLNPLKFLLSSVVYIFVVILLPFEFLVRLLQKQSKNLSSKTAFEQMKERELFALRGQSTESLNGFEQNESQIRRKQTYIGNKVQQEVQTFRNAKQKYETYLTTLRQGCADAVYDEMYKKLGKY